jgi:hypothetical protein
MTPTAMKQERAAWVRLLKKGSNRHPIDKIEEAAEAIVDLLTKDRSKKTTLPFLDSIFAKAEFEPGCDGTTPDILLTELFGFDEKNLPKVHNTFCSEAGHFVDALVIELLNLGCPDDVDATKASMEDLFDKHMQTDVGSDTKTKWKAPDCILEGRYIVEVKYRFNSFQSKDQQIKNGAFYAALGYTPIFLHLSPDCQMQDDFIKNGWIVLVGEDALDFIKMHTGFDLRLLFQAVAEHPVIKTRMQEQHEALVLRRAMKMCRTFEYSPKQSKGHLLKQISEDPESVSEVIARTPHVPPDLKEALRDRVDASMSARMDDIREEEMTPECISKDLLAAVATLDENEQQKIVAELLENMSEAGRLSLMSTMG